MFLWKFSDLVKKDVAEFSDKFSHFQYATLVFLINTHTFAIYCKQLLYN